MSSIKITYEGETRRRQCTDGNLESLAREMFASLSNKQFSLRLLRKTDTSAVYEVWCRRLPPITLLTSAFLRTIDCFG